MDLESQILLQDKDERELEKRLEKSLKIQERINALLKKRILKQ